MDRVITNNTQLDVLDFHLSARRITGTKDQVIAQLDELIEILVAVRQQVTVKENREKLEAPTRRRLRLVPAIGLALILGLAVTAGAQNAAGSTGATANQPPPAPELSYGGFVDVGYLRAFNDPLNQLFRSRGTAWHVNDLHLNMTGTYVKKPRSEVSRWGGELLVQTGKDDEIFGFSATAPNMDGSDVLRHFGLANVSYLAPAGKGLAIQGGIFSSLIGYDSLYAKDNFNYTRPWGADFTPYLMLGANASYPSGDALTGTFFVVNGYWHLANANSVPSSGVQLVYTATPEITVKNTSMFGPHQDDTSLEFWRVLNDTIVERRTDRFVIAFNGHFSTERVADTPDDRAWWVAMQLPMRWHVQGPWSVAFRPEVAWDTTGRWTLAEQHVTAVTSTLEYKLPIRSAAALLRLEHRFDRSTGAEGGFFADHESSPGVPALQPNQHLLVFGVILTFDDTR